MILTVIILVRMRITTTTTITVMIIIINVSEPDQLFSYLLADGEQRAESKDHGHVHDSWLSADSASVPLLWLRVTAEACGRLIVQKMMTSRLMLELNQHTNIFRR